MTTFIYPTDIKRVTSDFGSRWGSRHNGTDFADGGYHPIYAAADGKVRRSYLSSSYGECIMIEHHLHGHTWETVYAHMRPGSRKVHDGNHVKQGQVIGVMGSTGDSTGQHLHFELHKNGNWNIHKTNAVDPLDYIGKDLYPSSSSKGKSIYFPPNKGKWRVYPLNKTPKAGNEKGQINPDKFGGLTYDILGEDEADTYIIQSGDFGKVKVYGHKSTGAIIKDNKASGEAIVPYPGHLLKRGSKGKDVERIQRAVNVKADGIYGQNTEKSVRSYQDRHGLSVDGVVGPDTWYTMF